MGATFALIVSGILADRNRDTTSQALRIALPMLLAGRGGRIPQK